MYSTKMMNRTFSLALLLGFSYLSNVPVAANDNLRTRNVSVEQTQAGTDFAQDFISIFNWGIKNLGMTQKGLTVKFTVSHPLFEKEASFELNKSEVDSFSVLKLLASTILRNLVDKLVRDDSANNTIFGYSIKEIANSWKSGNDNVIGLEVATKLSEIVNSLSEKDFSDFEDNLLNFQKSKSKDSKVEGMKMLVNIKNDKENVELMKQRKIRNSKI